MNARRSPQWLRAGQRGPLRLRAPLAPHAARPAAGAIATALLLAGCGAGPGTAATGTAARPQHTAYGTAPATATPARSLPSPSVRPSVSPGASPGPAGPGTVVPVPPSHAALPQTRAFPSAGTAAFRAEMTDLWASVVTGKPVFGMRAFFPLAAYRQVKAIADPTSDWLGRLVADFRLDVSAAHDLLGHAARAATLVRVIVPAAQASWIDPGVCFNGVGYWHVAGARIVYRLHHQLRSIGIASLISWRGRWYVVHFGAVLRSSAVGVVDQPTDGVGVPGPPGGC
ncbi:MAG: hypothetical protein ABSB01_08160 [Streptosporangiaceae bacterium]